MTKGGRLIFGTPDYARLSWRIIEPIYRLILPGGYADEHITQYTREGLIRLIETWFRFPIRALHLRCGDDSAICKTIGDSSRREI